jgi:hypothetical protein
VLNQVQIHRSTPPKRSSRALARLLSGTLASLAGLQRLF